MNTAALSLDYISADEFSAQPASWWNTVLGVVGYGAPPPVLPARVPVTAGMTPRLDIAGGRCEVWRLAGDLKENLTTGSFERGRLSYRYGNGILFGAVILHEEAFGAEESVALSRATSTVYEDIFAVLKATGHSHLVRVWNYLPHINGDADGEERYRRFNTARQAAFLKAGRSTVGTVPAASAVGSAKGSPISVYFLAASDPPRMIENPRQVSAYHYPEKFGKHSPTFSRACMRLDAGGTNLFISGTASIVGHETIHQGDVAAQTRESVANIHLLLDEANRVADATRYSLDGLKLKVYVRRPQDLPVIARALSSVLPRSTSIVYVQADVCREELLVEIEAVGNARHG